MIGPATAADAPAVADLWERCGLVRPWNPPAADFARAIEGPSSAVLIAREADAIVGSIMVGHDGHRGWVYYLAVAPNRRRAGLGRALMTAAERWLRAENMPKLQLMVRADSAEALAFHRALGLQEQAVTVMGRFLD